MKYKIGDSVIFLGGKSQTDGSDVNLCLNKVGQKAKIHSIRGFNARYPYQLIFEDGHMITEIWDREIKLANSPNCKIIRTG